MNNTQTLDRMFKQYEKMFMQKIKINGIDSTGFFYEIQSTETNWRPDAKYLFVKRGSVKQGDLITALNENWLVSVDAITYNDVYDKIILQRCNNTTNFNFSGTVIPFPSIIVARTLGITEGNNANFVDGNMNVTIQDTANARRISIDQRIIFKNQAFLVSGIDSSAIGLITLNCRLTERSDLYDDYVNSIPDKFRYENKYEIFVNGNDWSNFNKFNIGLNQETKIIVEVWATRIIGGARFQVTNPILEFSSSDESILTIDNSGNVISLSEGSAIISVILKSNDTEDDYEIVTCYDLEVFVHDAEVIENIVTITGGSAIYFDAKSKYTAKLFENGLEIPDSFTFKIVDDKTGVAVPAKTAKISSVTATTCEIQVYAINAVIKLVATSNSTGIEESKSITIRDIM